ncbi:MAG: HipA domain-containing protein [Flammeovirgaceae bacterium]|nr:HipA domain-containing protein [Flammeovirgaceae bacterium]
MKTRCLFCYQPLAASEKDFHATCSRKIFGTPIPPQLNFSEDQMVPLAEKIIRSQFAVTGAQPKLSLGIEKKSNTEPPRFTIVGLWGNFILKPPTARFEFLPEIEDLTMHLAEISSIHVVPHSLVRLHSGSLAYITRRVDRIKKNKLHMEDMCQLTERLTEHKYHGSYEQIGKTILRYSQNPGLDLVNFFEQLLFVFLTGNADMHLKNFSLIDQPGIGYSLSPAYDHVATALVMPTDDEDLALTLNGKKKKIKRIDFEEALSRFELSPRSRENIFKRFESILPLWREVISISFLSEEMKKKYSDLVDNRWKRIFN